MLRRALAPLAALGLVAVLAACGEDTASDPDGSASPSESTSSPATATGDFPDGIAVTGDFGKEPEVAWTDVVSVDALATDVLIEGDGDAVAVGDSLLTRVWVGNGESQTTAYTSFAEPSPTALSVGDETLPALRDGLTGATVGSRVLIASPPDQAYGEQGNTQLGIGNADTVLFLVDIVSKLPEGPEGADASPAKWAPTIVEEAGDPTGLDFADAPEPAGKLLRTTLIKGTGDPVKKGEHLYVDYLGQVYGADAPFDQSYARGAPFDFVIGQGGVVKGWDQGLIGVPVGSRVILAIPPDLGYGEAGQPDVGIKGTDTMYFIVDVRAAT